MPLTKSNSLTDILRILHMLERRIETKYKTKVVGVFGSVVRGEAKKSSDVDILVQPQTGASLIEIIGLEYYLKKKLGRKVDVVSESSLKEQIKPYIYKDLVRL